MIPISVALTDGFATRSLITEKIPIAGVDACITPLHPSELFWRQLRYAEFDVSELSMASLIVAFANGDRTWKALPIFTTRRFFHTEIFVRRDAGIESPADLKGRRVGVPEFQQTAAVWTRGALLHEFGVDQNSIHWFMERQGDRSHASATGGVIPTGITLDHIPENSSLAAALSDGSIEAALHYVAGTNFIDKSKSDVTQLGVVTPLFTDPVREGIRYFDATGIAPMNHCVVIRSSLLDQHPWLALNVFDAFVASKEQALSSLRRDAEAFERIGAIPVSSLDVDPMPFGLRTEGRVVEVLNDYLVEQGLLAQRINLEELFAPTTIAM